MRAAIRSSKTDRCSIEVTEASIVRIAAYPAASDGWVSMRGESWAAVGFDESGSASRVSESGSAVGVSE